MIQTIIIGLIIMIPTIVAMYLYTQLEITNYKLEWWRKQAVPLGNTNRLNKGGK